MAAPFLRRARLAVFGGILGTTCLLSATLAPAAVRPAGPIPTAAAVADLLRQEPFSLESWPAWRARLLTWFGDTSNQTDEAFAAAQHFVRSQLDVTGRVLPPALAEDALAWYLLGNSYLRDARPGADAAALTNAEQALRRSLELDGSFARAHRNLALVLLLQDDSADPSTANGREARQELDQAHRLEPDLPLKYVEAQAAFWHQRYGAAEDLFRQALRQEAQDLKLAHQLAVCIVFNPSRSGARAPALDDLLRQFPGDGVLVCFHAAALAEDDDFRAAARELKRARQMGTDPEQVLPPELVKHIEDKGAPSWFEWAAWILGGFAGLYALLMGLMALAGLILASRTRGSRALQLLGDEQEALVADGQVLRAPHESLLARCYALALFVGLALFYLAIPFILAGLLAGTALLLYLIFLLPRISIKLIVIVVVVGLGGVWAILKSLVAGPGQGSFGVAKTAQQCPRLYQVLGEVAERVDTDPVNEVYLAPGSAIGVHQEGRGPFGLLGVKRRVLTLGLSTMHFLAVDELKAILAHEYAHFSHRDTFYSRFIYQVNISIQQALDGMRRSGGKLNYVNPFYWFLVLYYKAYNLLAAGFSRSREFLADRMASSLYGSDVFAHALTKVSTDGSLFEMTIYGNIARLLGEGKAFVNMYGAFRSYRDEQLTVQEREEMYQKLLAEKESLFASHPTFGERIEAVQVLPKADKKDPALALELFDNAEEIEKELTDFLTAYIHYRQRLYAQVAAQG